jgi:hypothetical protein
LQIPRKDVTSKDISSLTVRRIPHFLSVILNGLVAVHRYHRAEGLLQELKPPGMTEAAAVPFPAAGSQQHGVPDLQSLRSTSERRRALPFALAMLGLTQSPYQADGNCSKRGVKTRRFASNANGGCCTIKLRFPPLPTTNTQKCTQQWACWIDAASMRTQMKAFENPHAAQLLSNKSHITSPVLGLRVLGSNNNTVQRLASRGRHMQYFRHRDATQKVTL